ncbi:MAG: hypothetical protein PHO53_00080 [Actinomycetota bacterium]|nr:hypothetical protein [Actinomycetota bacterium]
MQGEEGVTLSPRELDLYREPQAAKFLATVSAEGEPNIALIISQMPIDNGKVAFGDFMMVKTKENLLNDKHLASVAVSEKLEFAGFEGEVEEWVDSGPVIDEINSIEFFRYNAYMGIHNVGIIRLTEKTNLPAGASYLGYLSDFLATHLFGSLIRERNKSYLSVPSAVRKRFNSLLGVKAIAFVGDDGVPRAFPSLAVHLKRGGTLVLRIKKHNSEVARLEEGKRIALGIVTQDAVSYQIKGDFREARSFAGAKYGVILIDEIYSSSPPLCGERLL